MAPYPTTLTGLTLYSLYVYYGSAYIVVLLAIKVEALLYSVIYTAQLAIYTRALQLAVTIYIAIHHILKLLVTIAIAILTQFLAQLLPK